MTRFDAVLFDCDGVIADSEGLTNGVLRELLAGMGWSLAPGECLRIFAGHALIDRADVIETHTGVRIDDAWIRNFRALRDDAIRAGLRPISGAPDAVRRAAAEFPLGTALASGADRPKIEMQLELLGLADAFSTHVYSGMDMPRSKPAPDVYLAAAAGLGAEPGRCAVVEDTVAGVQAGVAAGATVFGYAPGDETHADAETLIAAGAAVTFTRMNELIDCIHGFRD